MFCYCFGINNEILILKSTHKKGVKNFMRAFDMKVKVVQQEINYVFRMLALSHFKTSTFLTNFPKII